MEVHVREMLKHLTRLFAAASHAHSFEAAQTFLLQVVQRQNVTDVLSKRQRDAAAAVPAEDPELTESFDPDAVAGSGSTADQI